MNTLLSLIKVQFNHTFGLSALKQKYFRNKSLLWKPVVFLLAMGFALLPFEIGLVGFFNQFYSLLKMTGQEAVILTMLVLGGQLVVLLFGLFYLMSAFYFSADLKQLLPLPLRPRDIIGAKLTVVLACEYLTLLPLIVPVLILYGVLSAAHGWYWPFALAVFLVLPVIPLAVSSILIIPLMRFTALTKNRDLFRVVASLLGVTLFLLIRFTVNPSGQGPGGQQLQQWVTAGKALTGAVGAVFLPVNWAAAALSSPSPAGALLNLLLFAAVSLLLLFLALLLAGKWFFRGITGGSEIRSAGRYTGAIPAAAFRSRSPIAAAFWREVKVFFRTPVFVLNGLINYIMIPVLLFLSLRGGNFGEMPSEHLQMMVIINLVAAGVIVLNNMLSPVAATAISREGKMFWISKQLPMSPREQVTAKLLHAMVFPGIGAILISMLVIVFFKLPVTDLFIISVLGVAGSLPGAEMGLIIDLMRPNLDWTEPQRAIKGFNGFLAFLAGLPLLGIFSLAAVFLLRSGLRHALVYLFLTGALLLLGLALYTALSRLAEKRYPQI
jgi:ABC-2 type transport system permease protein